MITEILPSTAGLLGVPGFTDTLRLAERVGAVRRVVVLLVDGMGSALLPIAAQSAPFIADVVARRVGTIDELSCTFPSTTPTSLVSLGTGAMPGDHGVLGFTVNVPSTDRVLSHIVWDADPDPYTWQPIPTVFEHMAMAGIPSAIVLPRAFVGSGLTTAAYRGARPIGLRPRDDLATAMISALANARLVYGYTARLDQAMHRDGIASRGWSDAATDVGLLLERLVEHLPGDTALLVTADHGGLDVPWTSRPDLGTDARLSAGIRIVAGEPRVRYLHTIPGAQDDVVAAWRTVLGPSADVLTREEAIADGMFGRVTAEHALRVGDVVVICTGHGAILASGWIRPRSRTSSGSTVPAHTPRPRSRCWRSPECGARTAITRRSCRRSRRSNSASAAAAAHPRPRCAGRTRRPCQRPYSARRSRSTTAALQRDRTRSARCPRR